MLKFHSTAAKGEITVGLDAEVLPPEVNWIDVLRPSQMEVALLERTLGIVMPNKEDLAEIETSSRLYRDNAHLFMSLPMIVRLTSGLVSVIGIPPTLVASMYGMNFKYMPELEWPYGYVWGLALIAITALIPAAWFKRRGWW